MLKFERNIKMKKLLSVLLTIAMALAFTGCSTNKPSGDSSSDGTAGTQGPVIDSAVDFYTKVWNAFGSEEQFPAAGGDAENEAEGPAKFAMTEANAEAFKYLLHVNDALYDMLDDDVATLQHMMNTNTFSSAVAKLKDPSKAAEFAEAYKTEIQGQHWMCGFPDKVVVISVGAYVVMAYGAEDIIDTLIKACSEVEAQSSVLIDAPAVLD